MNRTTSTILTVLFFGFAFAKAQSECATKLSLYAEAAKQEKYDEAYSMLDYLTTNCQDQSAAIYQYGEQIYEHRIEAEKGEEDKNIQGLIDMLSTQIERFPDKIELTRKKTELAQVMFENKVGTRKEQFEVFDEAFKSNTKEFTDPRGIVTYFVLAEYLHASGEMDLEEMFAVYDDVSQRIQEEKVERSQKIKTLMEKQANPEDSLSDRDQKIMGYAEKNLSSYNTVQKIVDKKLGDLADCDKLIPLYEGQMEENKDDEKWLNNVLKRLQSKECTDDPLYRTVSVQLHKLKPSAKSAIGLARTAKTTNEKVKYYKQALDLSEEGGDLYVIHYRLGEIYKDRGQFATARKHFIKSNEANPSFGAPFLSIAEMIANSANSCGSNPFEKRAIYWIAARYASRAASVDPSLKSTANQYYESYKGRAPSSKEVFISDYNAGQVISFSCWVGESVKIPQA